MKVMCDGFGNAFGTNRNDVTGAERKFFSGEMGLTDGTMNVMTRFESGQQMSYSGVLDRNAIQMDMDHMSEEGNFNFQGRVQVVKEGTNKAAFKPLHTAGTIGGPVAVAISIQIDEFCIQNDEFCI